MALERVDWPRDDPRWFTMLEQPLRTWTHGQSGDDLPRDAYLTCFRLVLERCDPNLRGRPTDEQQFGLTTLHNIVARGDMSAEERVAFATAILDRWREARHPRSPAEEHAARVGLPVGTVAARGAVPRARRRSR